MEYVIVGLGNPGSEYEETWHNVGRVVVKTLQEKWETSDWRIDKKARAILSEGMDTNRTERVRLVLPDNYMNRSGASVSPFVKSRAQMKHLVVVHDDIDLGIGTIRIVVNRGAGGHKGVASIDKTLASRDYIRVRIGVSPVTPKGTVKKPKGEEAVHQYILRPMKKKEKEALAGIVTRAIEAIEAIIKEGVTKAMCMHNRTS